MAKTAKKTEEPKIESVAVHAAKAPKAPQSLFRHGLFYIVAAVLILMLVQSGVVFLLQKARETTRNDLAALQLKFYTAAVNTRVDQYEQLADSLAANPAPLLTAIAAGPTAIAPLEAQLLQSAPGAVEVRLSPPAVDTATTLTYAQQSMVTRAAYGQVQPPELGYLKQSRVLSLARPLKDANGSVAGVLIVTVPLKPLADAIAGFDPQGSHVELGQGFTADKSTVVVAAGSASDSVPLRTYATHNSNWELRFAPAESLGQDAMPVALLYGLLGAAVLAVTALFVLGLRTLESRLNRDLEMVDSYNENFLRFGMREKPQLQLSNFDNMLHHLDQYVAELRAGKKVVAKSRDEAERDGIAALDISAAEAEMLLGAQLPAKAAPAAKAPAKGPARNAGNVPVLPAEIFRAYDIRGKAGVTLTAEIVRQLGLAIGSEATAKADQVVIVGRDARLSSPDLFKALIDGLQASGRDVIDVGVVPSPVLYFAAKTLPSHSAVMLTGSHNPAEDNGLKIVIGGRTLVEEDIKALKTRIETQDFTSGSGGYSQQNVSGDYIERIASDVVLARPFRVVVDAGNGVAGAIAIRAFEALGCSVIPLFCEPDGNFPNHQPDPSRPENLEDLQSAVVSNGAHLGIAFDGDGDRIGFVTPAGEAVFADRVMMLLAKHVLVSNPGADIIFDVKCSRDLVSVIASNGGRPLMCRTGHSYLKAKLAETGAPLAGEMSGHIIFNDRWFGFDDAIYAAARVLEILSMESEDADAVFADFPRSESTPELSVAVAETFKQPFMTALLRKAAFDGGTVNTLDGMRVDFPDGWGLVRPSNTTASLVMRFEGRDVAVLKRIQQEFKTLMLSVEPDLSLPF
jgi:phosphomannomutase/phosphoglucomutase